MKRILINKQKIGLLYRNGDYKKVLLPGSYWIRLGDTVKIYDKLEIYSQLKEIDLLLADKEFSQVAVPITIQENEIAIVYFKNTFKAHLASGNYFYFKGMTDLDIQVIDLNSSEEINNVNLAVLKIPQVSQYVKTVKLEVYERGLLFRDGKLVKELSGGTYSYWNGSQVYELLKVDLRATQMELSGQELLTRDKAAIRVNFQIEYKVNDINRALLDNSNYAKQLYSAGQLALREIIGSMTLDELLESKDKVDNFVLNILKSKSDKLGVLVFQAGIRDIILPGDVKEIMNQVLIADKQAQANAIARREETASTRTMLNTAKLMEDNAILLKLKEMEYVEKIASKIGEIKLSNGGALIDQLSQVLAK